MHFARGAAAGRTAGSAIAAVASATTAAAGGLAGRAAIGATIGLILEAFACEELLLARAKREGAAAINAVEGFVCVQLLGVFQSV